MATSRLKLATKEALPLKLMLSGPAGAGKTFGSIRLAYGLRPDGVDAKDWKILVADTEERSANKYVGEYADGVKFRFFAEPVDAAAFSPDRLEEIIDLAVSEKIDVLVLDSASALWRYCLTIVDNEKKRSKSGDGISAWKSGDSCYRRWTQAILAAPLHVILNFRSKHAIAQERNEVTGKIEVKKLGLEPDVRQDFPFIPDVTIAIDPIDHSFVVDKTRCRKLDRAVFTIDRTKELAHILRDWLNDPEAVEESREADAKKIQEAAEEQTRLMAAMDEKLATFLLEVAAIDANGGPAAVSAAGKRAAELFGKAPPSVTSQVREAMNAKRAELGIPVPGVAPAAK